MFSRSKMVLIFVIIFLGCSSVANENCERVRFSSDDQKDLIKENFTEQSFEQNGKPVYYSVFGPKKKWRYSVIWWNKNTNKWLSQTKRSNRHLIGDKITKAKLKISNQNIF